MKILLICAGGMSTSLLVTKMQEAAQAKGIEAEIMARGAGTVKESGQGADMILLGPQIRYELKNVRSAFPDIPVEVIDMRDYGTMNGENVLNTALKAMNQ